MKEYTNPTVLEILRQRDRYKASAKLEAKHQELSALAVSKPKDNPNGSNLAIDARKARKQISTVSYDSRDKSVVAKQWVAKPAKAMAEPTATIKTHGKTDRDTCSYYRNKNGDNLPREVEHAPSFKGKASKSRIK